MGQKFRLQAIEFVILAMMGLAAFFVGCLANSPAEPSPAGSRPGRESFTIFLTGHVSSTLKPCGCSEDQLGGIERRSTVMNKVLKDQRMAVDTGKMIRAISEQDNLKMDILFQAMNMLDYSVVNLDMQDYQAASSLGLLNNNSFEVITAQRPGQNTNLKSAFSKQVDIAGKKFNIQVATIETSFPVKNWDEIFPASGNVLNILIVDTTDKSKLDNIISKLRVDVIICPSSSTEPRILDTTRAKPLIVSVGKYGEYLARMDLSLAAGKLKIRFDKIPISEKLKEDPEFVSLYQDYKNIVKDMDLLGIVAAKKIPLPDGLEYLGSDSCIVCHQYSHEAWSTKGHAKAYQTLVDVDFQYDPECIECHVIGLKYETGFASEESPPDLRNVGCEACHGPGSAHVSAQITGQKYVSTGIPRLKCLDCHTAEHSVNFDQETYMKKIVHWKPKKIEKSPEPSDK